MLPGQEWRQHNLELNFEGEKRNVHKESKRKLGILSYITDVFFLSFRQPKEGAKQEEWSRRVTVQLHVFPSANQNERNEMNYHGESLQTITLFFFHKPKERTKEEKLSGRITFFIARDRSRRKSKLTKEVFEEVVDRTSTKRQELWKIGHIRLEKFLNPFLLAALTSY